MIWDLCQLDDAHRDLISSFECFDNSDDSLELIVNNNHLEKTVFTDGNVDSGIDGLHVSLVRTEHACANFISDLDVILQVLNKLANAHNDVTEKTNSLMTTCENLLEQQHSLQNDISVLAGAISPFDDIEAVALLLGIPVDARGRPVINKLDALPTIDPRSPEFQGVLHRLSKALTALKGQHQFKDYDHYLRWLRQLQHRATSLVGRAMRDLLSQAAMGCSSGVKKAKFSVDDQPLESAVVYQKFRGLGFRMRELCNLLTIRNDLDRDFHGTYADDDSVLKETKQSYVLIRNELLATFVREIGVVKLSTPSVDGGSALCQGIRQLYTVLLRVTQLEQQLFHTLFKCNHDPLQPNTSGNSPRFATTPAAEDADESFFATQIGTPSAAYSIGHSNEVVSIVEGVCNFISDVLRPFIIREANVDELCRAVTTLTEDIRSQILSMFPASSPLTRQLIAGLDGSANDAQERLVYCAETQLRQQVQMFDPLPSQLAYPTILERFEQRGKDGVLDPNDIPVPAADEVSRSWYPPLHDTLGLLAKLYGVIELSVFEDFARRSVDLCVQSLQLGSDGVKRSRGQLHGDLFLVRHLLILREQLLPFEIRLQGIEKKLDFKPTGVALSHLARNTRSMWRLDSANGFLQLAWDGIPTLSETQVDAKRHLDSVLKGACYSLKQSALKVLLSGIDAFLAKVTAFAGEIPLGSPVLHSDVVRALKAQAFIKHDRIRDILVSAQLSITQTVPDLKRNMKLYVENATARNILLRPIQQDIEIVSNKMAIVIENCIEPGQHRDDLEQQLTSLISTIANDLFTQ